MNDGDILKFASKMPIDTLFNGTLEPFGIVQGEVVNLGGNENDVPDDRFLAYGDVELLATSDPNGFVDELIAVARRRHSLAPKYEVLQEQLSHIVHVIENVYHTVLLSENDSEFRG
jgi:hypothetical protein